MNGQALKTYDEYIPFEDGKKIFAAATSQKQFYTIPEANRANMLRLQKYELERRIIEFASK